MRLEEGEENETGHKRKKRKAWISIIGKKSTLEKEMLMRYRLRAGGFCWKEIVIYIRLGQGTLVSLPPGSVRKSHKSIERGGGATIERPGRGKKKAQSCRKRRNRDSGIGGMQSRPMLRGGPKTKMGIGDVD